MAGNNASQAGLCECGCGKRVSLAAMTNRRLGHIKGQPVRFRVGHGGNHIIGEKHPQWKGGRTYESAGYLLVTLRGHPRAVRRRYVMEHIVIAERALGHYLPAKAEVHHVNGIKFDNRNSNLVVCQDRSYHRLLHRRQRALDGCGNANWRHCWYCKTWDDPKNLKINNCHCIHPACHAQVNRNRRERYAASQKARGHMPSLITRKLCIEMMRERESASVQS